MPPLTALNGPAEQQRNQSQLQFDGYHRTPSRIIQHIPIAPCAGPAGLEQYSPATPVRVPLRPPPSPFPMCTCSLSYCASSYRKCPTTVTSIFLSMWQSRIEDIPALECRGLTTLKISRVITFTTLAHVSTSFA
jgi:hypothetical protein